ncbi:MAG: 3-deoxy-manno-octulosonate cytidylyltransferase, partial [Rhizobium oryzihabitans]
MKNRDFEKAVVLIPARMASTRLPGKPLADIGGKPMIVQVALRAREAGAERIVVAVDDEQVFSAVKNAGFDVMMTRDDHQSGSDRIFEALQKADPYGKAEYVINVQGDLPTIEAETIRASLRPLENAAVDIATLTVEITDEDEKTNPNVVKVVGSPLSETRLRALYFTRTTAPYGDGPLYHHIGLYTYRRAALERFVSLPPSPLEKRERLEQLRALEAGMRIDAEIVRSVPL